jgi:hypothetical protein
MTIFKEGECYGRISGVSDMAQLARWTCSPVGAKREQTLRIVVQYIDARPARMQERFTVLALEALKEVWPCRRK